MTGQLAQSKDPQYQLVELKPEEAKAVTADLDVLMKKHSVQFVITPIIAANGTLSAKAEIYKKLELVPKGVPSPFVEANGEKPIEPTGSEEAQAA